jgi:hypothetical protein
MADLKDGSAFKSLVLTWGKKLGWRPQDIKSLVQQPRRVQKMDAMLTEMEEGRLKVDCDRWMSGGGLWWVGCGARDGGGWW